MRMLRELRKAQGLTMKELGEVIGVAESTMSLYETGKREPDFDTLSRLSQYFNVTVDYLLFGNGPGAEDAHIPAQTEAGDMGVLLDSLIDKLKSGKPIMFKNYSLTPSDAALLASSLESVEKMTAEMARQKNENKGGAGK